MDYVLIFGHSSIANLKHVRVCTQQCHFKQTSIFFIFSQIRPYIKSISCIYKARIWAVALTIPATRSGIFCIDLVLVCSRDHAVGVSEYVNNNRRDARTQVSNNIKKTIIPIPIISNVVCCSPTVSYVSTPQGRMHIAPSSVIGES